MGIAIKIDNLYHEFKGQVVLNNISIDFEENKIYGLLGKNGAGKTTFLNIISNQLISKEGSIEILGKNLRDNSHVLENICIVKEREFANNEVKVKYIFDIYSYFYKDYDKELEKKLCEEFKIDCKKQYKKLSRGTKSLISNIIGICSNASITIFDEPAIGLDAVNRDTFYNLLLESYVNNPRTIIISTHLIDEIEKLVENVVIINNGKIIINDSTDNALQKSLYISGRKKDLEKLECIKGKVAYKSFGSKESYSYYGDLSENDLNLIDELDLNLESMSLQEMFINSTKGE